MITENVRVERPGTYTMQALALRLGVSIQSVKKWDAEGRIVGRVKIGRAVRFDAGAVERQMLSGIFLLPSPK